VFSDSLKPKKEASKQRYTVTRHPFMAMKVFLLIPSCLRGDPQISPGSVAGFSSESFTHSFLTLHSQRLSVCVSEEGRKL